MARCNPDIMPKYRILNEQELRSLEKQFTHFLAANGISADYWEKLKIKDPLQVDALIEQFSDFIFETSLSNADIIEYRTTNQLIFYYHENTTLNFIKLEIDAKLQFDLKADFEVDELLQLIENQPDKVNLYFARKKNSSDKTSEFFNLISSGCRISKNLELFSILKNIVTKTEVK
jgi:hypothetical protein